MPIITTTDLQTNLYPEVIAEITRNDNTIAERAVTAAISEAKMYLSRYDLVQLFGTDIDAPAIQDEHLKSLVKDLACWHLLRLSNTGVDYTLFRTAYQDAIATLKNIMSGQAQPQGWPYLDTSASDAPAEGNTINWSSNPRRNNFY